MKVLKFFGLLIFLVISSCSEGREESTYDIKVTNHSLSFLNDDLKNKNDSLYKVLESKLKDSSTAQVASLWFPKAILLQYQSGIIYKFLDTLTSKSASLINADTLNQKLHLYKSQILRIDTAIYTEIKNSSQKITHDLDSIKKFQNLKLYFKGKSNEQVLLVLNQTKNNIETIENQVLQFCINKIR